MDGWLVLTQPNRNRLALRNLQSQVILA
jgi:hypothetical protein